MSITKALVVATVLVFALFVSPSARAEMTDHEGSDHEHHGTMGHARKQQDSEPSSHIAEADPVFERYFAILASLSQNTMKDVQSNAKAVAEEAAKLEEGSGNKARHARLGEIAASAKSLGEKTEIGPAREEFGKLSEKMIEYQKEFGGNESDGKPVYYCGMAKKKWVQRDKEPGNPYYGPSMAMCRSKIK